MTFHIKSQKFSEQRPNLKFCPPNFVNSTMGEHFKPYPELIGHHPRSVNLFLGDHQFFGDKKFKNRFFRQIKPIYPNFFYSINLSVVKVYTAKNIFRLLFSIEKQTEKSLLTLRPYGRAPKIFFWPIHFFLIFTHPNKYFHHKKKFPGAH